MLDFCILRPMLTSNVHANIRLKESGTTKAEEVYA